MGVCMGIVRNIRASLSLKFLWVLWKIERLVGKIGYPFMKKKERFVYDFMGIFEQDINKHCTFGTIIRSKPKAKAKDNPSKK